MFKNYIIIAIRSFWRSKVHSLINVAGLGLGITCCILISLFLKDEWTFDTFHTKASSIYRAYVKEDYGDNQKFFNTVTPFPLANTLKQNFPEVETALRINPVDTQVKIKDEQFDETVVITDQDFFRMFDFKVLYGERERLLALPSDLVITKRIAEKYFGDASSALNKVMSIEIGNGFSEFNIKGIVDDIPDNSSIQFDFLISADNFPKLYSEGTLTSSWFNVYPETYVLLRDGSDVNALSSKFPSLLKSLLGDDYEKSKYFVGLQPLTNIHLNTAFPAGIAPVSNPQYSYILAGVASLILFLACINFVTLSIGRTITRAKEVGIRKVVGAVRKQLIIQFVGEALLITVVALLVGVAIAGLGLPLFNDLSGKSLKLTPDLFTISTGFALMIVIGLLAGSYPAFVLSDFKPIAILKGKLQGNSKQTLRKVLVGVQLVFSVFLVSSALIMTKQLQYLQEKNLGFNKEQVLVLQLNADQPAARLAERVTSTFAKAERFKSELSKIPGVLSASSASHDFGNGSWTAVGYTDDKGAYQEFSVNIIDEKFIPSMNMEMVEGRNFSSDSEADRKRGLIVNEAFVKVYGWTSALGQRIPGKKFVDHEIIGVVKDFNYASLYTEVQPLAMAMDLTVVFSGIENVSINNSPVPKVFLRLQPEEMSTTIKQVEETWKRLAPAENFTFTFIDDAMNRQYRNDQNLAKIIQVATILSVLIGSLGLYALASLTMQSRVREISIRKVLGATSSSLLVILSRDFMAIIVISLIVSIPFTISFMKKWLESFQYKVDISWDTFFVAGSISVLIGVVTISYQAIKVTLSQPAETLKNE